MDNEKYRKYSSANGTQELKRAIGTENLKKFEKIKEYEKSDNPIVKKTYPLLSVEDED